MASTKETDQKSTEYVRHLQENRAATMAYYRKSLEKTEQQKFLERILKDSGADFSIVADVACGGGTLSYHLSELFPQAEFHLSDLNPEAIELAKELCRGDQFRFTVDSLFDLKTLRHGAFDAVFCWQTLLLFDDPSRLMHSLLRLPRAGGKLFVMSLFNVDRDVDLYTRIIDHTRTGNQQAEAISYNTFSHVSVDRWLSGTVSSYKIHPFHPEVDFSYEGRGLGTSTIAAENRRLQVSGGCLMNWGLLEVTR